MNSLHRFISSFGSVALFGIGFAGIAQAQSSSSQWEQLQPWTAPSQTDEKSSSLGGPITPTQPDFFAGNQSTEFSSSTSDGSRTKLFKVGPVQPTSNKPPAPLIGDPPRPRGGGLINVQTD